MCVWSKNTIIKRQEEIIEGGIRPEYINPASVDICIGMRFISPDISDQSFTLSGLDENYPKPIRPGQFILVETMETLIVPNNAAIELKLKSSRAREGWNHSLAFWFDPGWYGIGTMELKNITESKALPIWPGMRIAQIIIHNLDTPVEQKDLYNGRYQNATTVEGAKN
jgi:dCTP deaminase